MNESLYANIFRTRVEEKDPLPPHDPQMRLLGRACMALLGECKWGKYRPTDEEIAGRFRHAISTRQTRLLLRENVLSMLLGHPTADELPAVDPRMQVFLDRVLMRFFATPSVIVYLQNQRVTPEGSIEMVFSQLPEEIIPKIAEVVGVPDGEAFSFNDPDTEYPCTGYRFTPREEDLEGIILGPRADSERTPETTS